MRTNIILQDDLVTEARKITGIKLKSVLVHEGLRALIRERAREALLLVEGTDPNASAGRRRRS